MPQWLSHQYQILYIRSILRGDEGNTYLYVGLNYRLNHELALDFFLCTPGQTQQEVTDEAA